MDKYCYYDIYIWSVLEDEISMIKTFIEKLNKQVFKRLELIQIHNCNIPKNILGEEYYFTVEGYYITVKGCKDMKLINNFLKILDKAFYINFYCVKRGEKDVI